MENELRKQKLSKLALINEQLVSLLPNSFSSKAKLIDWLNSNPYSPYITLYGGENALLYNQEKSFISPTDGKNRFILEDEFSFKLENFTSFDNQILSANEPLSKIINCKQLFKNYPEFQNLEININISNANNGYFSGNTLYSNNKANKINIFASNNKEAMRVLLHELQHCIQLKEGFKIGTSYYNEHGVMDLFVGLNKTQSIDEIKNTLSKDTMFNDEVLFKEVFENHQYFNENKDGLKAKLIYIDPYDYIEAVNKVKPTHKHSENKLQSLKNAYDNGIKVPVPYLTYGSRDEASSDFGQEGYNRAVHATYIGRRSIPVFVRYRENDENIPQAIKNAIDFEKSSFSDIATKKSMVEIDSSKAIINMDILSSSKTRILGDVLRHDTLYTKYPTLYGLKVNVLNIDSHAAYGKNEITISQNLIDKENVEEIKSSLIHEIQHAIQNIENWARGGSPDEFANNKELKKLLQEQQEELKKSVGYNNWEYEILLEDYDKYIQLLEKGKNNYSVKPFYEEFVKEKNLKEDIAQYFVNKMLYFDNEISSLNSSDNPYDSYQRLWGEQQARAVQYRMNMTDKERAKESWTNTLEQKEGQYSKPIVKYSNEENQLKAEKENTSRLKEWHKDSHSLTKNENGTPKIFYHGTRADSFDVFDISKPLYGEQAEGAYFSSSKSNAKKYGDKIYAVYLKFENPLVIDAYGQNYNDIADSINHQSKWAKEDGYDSVIIKNIKDAPNGKGGVVQDTLIALEPTQIKSVNNQIFNENNPNIMMNQSMSQFNLLENELKALLSKDKLEEYITLSDEKKIISILENIIVTDITNNNLQKEFYKTFGKDISNLKDIHIDTKKEIISSLSSYENYVDLKQSKLHCDALLNILNKDYDELLNKISTYKDWDFLANTEYSLSNYLSTETKQNEEIILYHGTNEIFDKFERMGNRLTSIGTGHYFTPDLNIAKQYGKYIKSIKINKNYILDLDNPTKAQKESIIKLLDEVVPNEIKAGYGEVKKIDITTMEDKEAIALYKQKKEETKNLWHDRAKAQIVEDFETKKAYIQWQEVGLQNATTQNIKNLIQEYRQSIPKELGYKIAKSGSEIAIYDTNLVNQNLIEDKKVSNNSKIANEDGSPKVFYHGTSANFTSFKINTEKTFDAFGSGIYFTDKRNKAEHYGEKVIEVHLNMNNPLYINDNRTIWNNIIDNHLGEEWSNEVKKLGYDGIIVNKDYQNIVVAFEPSQINIINQATSIDIEKESSREKNFNEWFGNSKVVDINGNPLVVYHGSLTSFDTFDTSFGELSFFGRGGYFSSSQKDADIYASKNPEINFDLIGKAENMAKELEIPYSEAREEVTSGNEQVYPVYLSIQNPLEIGGFPIEATIKELENSLRIAQKNHPNFLARKIKFLSELDISNEKALYDSAWKLGAKYEINRYDDLIKKIIDGKRISDIQLELMGGDGARELMITQNKDGIIHHNIDNTFKYMDIASKHYFVRNPTQIKSIYNIGTFDKNNPKILEKNDLGLRNLEMIMSIIPNNMNMDTVKDYLFFNNITHEQLRGTIYNDILNSPKFDASKIRIPNTNSIDFDTAYFQSAGEKESREIESLYIHQDLNNLLAP